MKKFILDKIKNLQQKHKCNDPVEIAKNEGIIVLYENLPESNGYYNKVFRIKMIHINNNLSERDQYFTFCHELGHAMLHENSNTPFLRNNSFISTDKLEIEANMFAAALSIDDNLLENYKDYGYTLNQIALVEDIPVELIKLKFEL